MTGGKLDVQDALIRSIAAYCREDRNVVKMYIGIGSGSDAISAMKRRYDDFKRDEDINHMVALYSSSSEGNSKEMEKALCDYFYLHGRHINRAPGGGGRPSGGPCYYIYLAMRRWG